MRFRDWLKEKRRQRQLHQIERRANADHRILLEEIGDLRKKLAAMTEERDASNCRERIQKHSIDELTTALTSSVQRWAEFNRATGFSFARKEV